VKVESEFGRGSKSTLLVPVELKGKYEIYMVEEEPNNMERVEQYLPEKMRN